MNILISLVLAALVVTVASSYRLHDLTLVFNEEKTRVVRFEDKEYHFLTDHTSSWYQSFLRCRDMGAMLVSIPSEDVNNLLESVVLKNGWKVWNGYVFWTSGIKLGNGDKYVWSSTGEPIVYSNWAPGEPNVVNNTESCIEVADRKSKSGSLTWNDNDCNKSWYTICEK